MLGVAAFAGVALLCGGYAASVGWEVAGALRTGAAAFAVHPRDAMLVPLAVAFACFAALGTVPDLEIAKRPSRRSPRARRADRIATRLFGAALIAAFATLPSAPLAGLVLGEVAAARGYARCPDPSPNRFGLRRWARTRAACRADLR